MLPHFTEKETEAEEDLMTWASNLAQGHSANKWQSQGLSPAASFLGPIFLIIIPHISWGVGSLGQIKQDV